MPKGVYKHKKLSEETKAKIGSYFRGRKLSEEHKKKIKEGHAKYWLGKHRDDKTKEKLRLSPVLKNRIRENNATWKGDKASYLAFHSRVQRYRGKASKCTICKTEDAKKYEWANLTGNYSNIFDYQEMCTTCHIKYDKKRRF